MESDAVTGFLRFIFSFLLRRGALSLVLLTGAGLMARSRFGRAAANICVLINCSSSRLRA